MTANRSLRLILAGGLVALVAACGGGASAQGPDSGSDAKPATADATPRPTDVPMAEENAAPGTKLNACEIVTADEIASATGAADVADGKLEAAPTVLDEARTACTYEGEFGRIIVDLGHLVVVNLDLGVKLGAHVVFLGRLVGAHG